jgi:hypothetical protein
VISDDVAEAIQAVESDLAEIRANHDVNLRLGELTPELREMWKRHPGRIQGLLPCLLEVDGRTISVAYVSGGGSKAETIAVLADDIQDDVIGVIGGAWPKCPFHSHPLTAELVGDVPVWRCSELKTIVRTIGSSEGLER